jgi:inhibitor of KinA sporulation pathway (predicted exonuclease)
MHYIVFDLEATCWETQSESHQKKQEIIEIGAVKIDEDGEILGKFAEFVRPIFHTQLSPFCTKLTSITQVDVNRARYFTEVVEDFKEWVGAYDEEDYLFCSWGFFDQRALSKNCLMHNLDDAWTMPHISLKHQYPRVSGIGRTIGLKAAVLKEGFEFSGLHHRGIDDALNLAKVFNKFLYQWEH